MKKTELARKALCIFICFGLCFALSFVFLNNRYSSVAEAPADTASTTLSFSDGAVYVGETIDGNIRSGTGVYTWETGETYEGSWTEDKIEGRGKMTWPGLGVYVGDFSQNKRNGNGSFIWTYEGLPEAGDPVSFDGNWTDDKIGNYGTLVLSGIGTYEGEFVNERRSGKGKFTWENGDVYDGEWLKDAINGQGELKLSDGTGLSGVFKNGTLMNGKVVYNVNDGTAERNVKNGKANTAVKIVYNDGTTVEGKTKNNAFTGNVTINYGTSGDVYTGALKDGKKHGQGTYTWKNGAHYKGAWENDKMSGQGTFYYGKDEKSSYLSGKFNDGLPDGTLTYIHSNKIKYTTTWSNGQCVSIKYKKK